MAHSKARQPLFAEKQRPHGARRRVLRRKMGQQAGEKRRREASRADIFNPPRGEGEGMARVCVVVMLLIASTSGAGAATAQTHSERAENALRACEQRSTNQVSKGRCYSELARSLAVRTKRATEDRLSEIEVADPSISGGSQNVAAAREAAKKADTAWGAVLALECDKLAGFQMYGGSGVGLHQQSCEIKWLAARLDVMQVPIDKYP